LMSAAVRDVSDRKAAEERISELALIVESSQDAILTKTLDG
jgi:PAS domain-containing protein